MDCGATCLAMIIQFYEKKYSINKIRELCNTSIVGISLLNISKAAEFLLFKTLGSVFSFNKLINNAPLPCILHWNQDHFVVLYKVKKKRKDTVFYIADPGKGLLQYNEKDFTEHWISTKTNGEEKGVALLLEPTEQF
jgi:ATP-binding cassette subfamily B protein